MVYVIAIVIAVVVVVTLALRWGRLLPPAERPPQAPSE